VEQRRLERGSSDENFSRGSSKEISREFQENKTSVYGGAKKTVERVKRRRLQ
jgi:hypothetical protein